MAAELFKGAIHFLTGSLGLTMALYSALRLMEATTHRTHLLVNVLIYLALWAFEVYQTWTHWAR